MEPAEKDGSLERDYQELSGLKVTVTGCGGRTTRCPEVVVSPFAVSRLVGSNDPAYTLVYIEVAISLPSQSSEEAVIAKADGVVVLDDLETFCGSLRDLLSRPGVQVKATVNCMEGTLSLAVLRNVNGIIANGSISYGPDLILDDNLDQMSELVGSPWSHHSRLNFAFWALPGSLEAALRDLEKLVARVSLPDAGGNLRES